MSTKLQEAIASIKVGDKQTGKRLLTEILKTNPHHEEAWLWLSQTISSDEERIKCLQNVLKINPKNKSAQRGLASLTSKQLQPPPDLSLIVKPEGGAAKDLPNPLSMEPAEQVKRKPLKRLTPRPAQSSPSEPPAQSLEMSPVPGRTTSSLDLTRPQPMSSAAALQKVASARTRGITPMLNGVDLHQTDLSGADLSEASLCDIDLSQANLFRANLRHSNLTRAKLTGANLSQAILSETFLHNADLKEANLTGANLNGVHLNAADLSGADLSGANLDWADLRGASLNQVKYNDQTKWPVGFVPPGKASQK